MDTKKIEGIVLEVFDKAKTECVSHSKYALSNHVGNKIQLSFKTLERAYDRYINKKESNGSLNAESINLLCTYLGYIDYEDYIKSTPKKLKLEPLSIVKGNNWKPIIIYIGMAFGAIAFITLIMKSDVFGNAQLQEEKKCMSWVNTEYLQVACSSKTYSNYGTPILEYDSKMTHNFKKVSVTMATKFFTEDGKKPLIWYYKNKKREIEYFTAPGLHPINGETLKKITPGIINKYVPVHSNKPNSFIQ